MEQFKNLMVSVSGVRGIVGEGLTPNVAMLFAQAYGSQFPGKVVVGRDSRVTGPMLKHAVWAGLMSVGCDVVDVDITTTPTTELIADRPEHSGGIILTASHNPKQWNALKLLGPDGMFLNQELGDIIVDRIRTENFAIVPWDKIGTLEKYNNAAEYHIDLLLDLPLINEAGIRAKKFKIVVDCCNGAGGVILPQLFEALGCDAIFLNKEPTGLFPREPEPVPKNLNELISAVKAHNADIGCAVDPDVDRLALVSEKGRPLGEEYTLALATQFVLSHTPGDVVVNASTTRAIDDIVKQSGGRVHRTPVGEIHVASRAKEIDAVIAGEGNGGVIYPEFHAGRDALVGIAFMLQLMTETGKPLSELHKNAPQYTMVKDKIQLSFDADAKSIVGEFADSHSDENVNTIDGVKLLFRDSWVHVRASNTEPIIRIIAEAPTKQQAREMVDDYKKEIKRLEQKNRRSQRRL